MSSSVPRRRTLPTLAGGFYVLAVALLFWAAAWTRFHLPSPPLSNSDTWGFLYPALSKLSGGPFQHTHTRNFVYPAFLLFIIAPAKNLAVIPIVQHLLGLAAGGLLLACWHNLRRFVGAVPGPVYHSAGLVMAAIFLFSQAPLLAEHSIRAEAIIPFFVLLNILLTLKFFERRARGEKFHALAIAVLINSVLLSILKINFILCALCSVVPVLLVLFRKREERLRNLALVAPALAVAMAFALVERHLAQDDPATNELLPKTLFTIHANLIVREMDDAIARGDCTPESCEWLSEVAASLHRGIAASQRSGRPGHTLGLDPDYLFYLDPEFNDWTARYFQGDDQKKIEFFAAWYWRTLRCHPGALAAKMLRQLLVFYTVPNPSFSLTSASEVGSLYRATVNSFGPHQPAIARMPLLRAYLDEARQLTASTERIAPPLAVTVLNFALALLYLPILLAVCLSSILFLFSAKSRALWGSFAVTSLFVFSYNFGHILLTAVLHTADNPRYSQMQFPMSLLAIFVGGFFLAEVALRPWLGETHEPENT